jgi:hypothetical protein
MENLWPDFDEMPKISTPGTILKEQARALGARFHNKIVGDLNVIRNPGLFMYSFRLECPLLGYRYLLFKAEYGLIDFYPIKVTVVGDIAEELSDTREESVIEAPNEKEFKAILSRIFSAKKIKHVINALLQHLE